MATTGSRDVVLDRADAAATTGRADRWRSRLVGPAVAVGVAILLWSRFGWRGGLSRDEAVYVYAGQQLARGVPPYVSIFDPKAPLSAGVMGLAALVGRALGVDELLVMRVVFCGFACLTVVVLYLLAEQLWASRVGALATAVVFASFPGYARDAMSGPDVKTLAVLLVVSTLLLTVRRSWFRASLLAGLGCVCWQPLVLYGGLLVVLAVGWPGPVGRRLAVRRGLAGPALVGGVTAGLFLGASAFDELVESAVVFPLTGLHHAAATWPERVATVREVLGQDYGPGGVLVLAGLVLLVGAVVGRAVVRRRQGLPAASAELCVLLPGLGLAVGFTLYDVQGYPDLFPVLVYAALGFGAAIAGWGAPRDGRPIPVTLAVTLALAGLVAVSWVGFGASVRRPGLDQQVGWSREVEALVRPGTSLYALGDPAPLVLTGRTNPDRYVFVSSGVGVWRIAEEGGFDAWKADLIGAEPSVVVIHGAHGPIVTQFERWLRSRGFEPRRLGQWLLLVAPS